MPANYRWGCVAFFIALPTLIPVTVVLGSLLSPDTEIWRHLLDQVLPRVTVNTLVLASSVTVLATVLGVGLAWLTAVCEFPGRSFFAWSLVLPMAVPGYVMGFVLVGWFEYAGPLHTLSRAWLGSSEWLPNIRSLWGVIVTLTLVLFPYPYLITRNAFLTQGRRSVEVAQSLGLSRTRGFFRVTLPMARPWIVGGAMLVMMETLADFGTVSVFNFDTFTTAIYKSWFGLFSIAGALQLASILMLFVLLIVLTERRFRARRGYETRFGDTSLATNRLRLTGRKKIIASLSCASIVAVGFALPISQLAVWAWEAVAIDLDYRYARFMFNSFFLSSGSALLVAMLGLILAYAVRQHGVLGKMSARLATLGYALPGVVLAVGLFAPVATFSKLLQGGLSALSGEASVTLVLQSTLLVMFMAYVARFMAVAYTPIESNMNRLSASIDDASRGMGVVGLGLLSRVHLPLLKGGVITAMVLVFVDTMKELPITLMTRPFGWDTLAIRVFELTSEGFWERAALPGLSIVLVGLIPVAILVWKSEYAT